MRFGIPVVKKKDVCGIISERLVLLRKTATFIWGIGRKSDALPLQGRLDGGSNRMLHYL
jgi:hypothetical protein